MIRHDPAHKVFVIGLSRTGTKSTTMALRRLGYCVQHFPNDPETVDALEKGTLPPVLDDVDGLADTPAVMIWRRLAETYPNAKFVLTVRARDAWLASCEKHWSRYSRVRPWPPYVRMLHSAIYGCVEFNAECFTDAYDRHVAAVREYFAGTDRLLILDVQKMAWGGLCPFLGHAIPDEDFPHVRGNGPIPVLPVRGHRTVGQRCAELAERIREGGCKYVRWGDGEQASAMGLTHWRTDSGWAPEEVGAYLTDTLNWLLERQDHITVAFQKAVWRHAGAAAWLTSAGWPARNKLADWGWLPVANRTGQLAPLFDAIRESGRVVSVCTKPVTDVFRAVFDSAECVECNPTHALRDVAELAESVRALAWEQPVGTLLLSCGPASLGLMRLLADEPRITNIVDVGSIFDPYAGILSRPVFHRPSGIAWHELARMNFGTDTLFVSDASREVVRGANRATPLPKAPSRCLNENASEMDVIIVSWGESAPQRVCEALRENMSRQTLESRVIICEAFPCDDEPTYAAIASEYGDRIQHVAVPTDDATLQLFQKEALFNLAARYSTAPKLAFVDGDVWCSDRDWWALINGELDASPVVQPWRNVYDKSFTRVSAARQYAEGRRELRTGQGMAWAMRREYFDAVGGWNPLAMLGCGDCLWLAEILPEPLCRSANTVAYRMRWFRGAIRRLDESLRIMPTYVDVALTHVHHGPRSQRMRHNPQLCIDRLSHGDVSTCVGVDERGLLSWIVPPDHVVRQLVDRRQEIVSRRAARRVVSEILGHGG